MKGYLGTCSYSRSVCYRLQESPLIVVMMEVHLSLGAECSWALINKVVG